MAKPVCCDTSFLFSLCGNDSPTAAAMALIQGLGRPVTLSTLNEFELENSLRLAVWRGLSTPAELQVALGDFASDLQLGRLVMAACNFAQVIADARRLSLTHTLNAGHRGFDILHVAAALQFQAGDFLTFDANQRRLARASKLKVSP